MPLHIEFGDVKMKYVFVRVGQCFSELYKIVYGHDYCLCGKLNKYSWVGVWVNLQKRLQNAHFQMYIHTSLTHQCVTDTSFHTKMATVKI